MRSSYPVSLSLPSPATWKRPSGFNVELSLQNLYENKPDACNTLEASDSADCLPACLTWQKLTSCKKKKACTYAVPAFVPFSILLLSVLFALNSSPELVDKMLFYYLDSLPLEWMSPGWSRARIYKGLRWKIQEVEQEERPLTINSKWPGFA